MEKNKKYVSNYPELLDEWDYDRNSDVNPSNVTSGSHQKIWWLCQKHKHSWQAIVKNRAKGVGCPCCAGLQISIGFNDLASQYPELAEEWDCSKNGDLKPTDVTHGTSKKVWWQCKKYHHSWQAIIANRTLHRQGCPYCAGRKALEGFNDLVTTDPDIANEWDYSKNGDLYPTAVTRGSNKTVWWKCKMNHR